jgi:hypothetical protein
MNLVDYRNKYAGLKSAAVKELIKSDTSFREITEDLYVSIFHKAMNKKCSDCWMDAYIVLMKSDIEKLMEQQSRQFELRAGALLRDVVNGDNSKLCSAFNLTDELALYHLSTNPSYIKFFSKVPENWEELVAVYNGQKPSVINADESKGINVSPEAENAEKAVKKAAAAVKTDETLLAKAKQAGASGKIGKLEARLEKHKAILSEAEAALAQLSAE